MILMLLERTVIFIHTQLKFKVVVWTKVDLWSREARHYADSRVMSTHRGRKEAVCIPRFCAVLPKKTICKIHWKKQSVDLTQWLGGYMHTMLASCVLNDYVSFYKFIFIIYLPLKLNRRAVITNPRPHGGLEWMCRALAALCYPGTWRRALIVVVIWAYSFILAWIANWMFFGGTGLNIYL